MKLDIDNLNIVRNMSYRAFIILMDNSFVHLKNIDIKFLSLFYILYSRL